MDDFKVTWKNLDTNEEFNFTVQSRNDTSAEAQANEILERDGQGDVAEIMDVVLI